MDPERKFGRGGLNPFLDVDDLVDDIGLDEDEVDWRKEFIGFDAEDERRLSELEPMLRERRHQIAEDFYDNLTAHEQTREVIERSPKDVEQLKQTQQAYLVSLATGGYDLEYFKDRARIGKLHEMIDMPLKHYVGQYGVYYDLLLSEMNNRVQEQVTDAIEAWADRRDDLQSDERGGGVLDAIGFGGSSDEETDEQAELDDLLEEAIQEAVQDGVRDVLSLLRIINLDLQVAADTYVDAYNQRLERAIDRRDQLAHEVESDVKAPIEELYDASQAVANRAETISELTEQQADDVGRAATELSDVSAAVEEVASVADEVNRTSEQTEELAASGAESADEALSALEDIDDATDRVSSAATDLEERTDEIDAVVERIDDLAKRTKVLATNANIEASRSAGGSDTLGVIAEEVMSFSERARQDLEVIEEVVEEVRQGAVETVETMDETVELVDDGTDRVRATVDDLDAIHESAQATASGMEDVAAATDQQAESVEVIATTVEDVAEAADHVAGEAEAVAAASEEQTANVREVVRSVTRLTETESFEEEPPYKQVQQL
ncbi:protoglobin domain-containing protein [Natribaculum luteum]|uniref:Protoglobin domain-containing protein n=1 Tax=Natribaculum luteum TaxID=1586232 RepID=A0ABD5NYL6_9EURY|nr:globin-coupled sensor protein [Natribaculum luteum]